MFELYSTGMKTQQLEEEEMFICHIHSYTEYNPAVKWRYAFNPSKSTHTWSSGHTHTHVEQWTHKLTHTWSSGHIHTWSSGHTHTPGAADTHTHTDTHTWSSGHTHTHLEQWAHTHTHTHTWSSQRCGARGAVGGSVPCSRVSPQSWTIPAGAENPQPQITSPALYPLGHGCTSIITYSYTVLLHIQCGSVKSNAILIKIHKHIKSYSIASEIPSNVRFFSEI